MARWRSGLTHMPFTHTFMGSNPVWVTKRDTYKFRTNEACFIYRTTSLSVGRK